jgi:DNA processing protein
MLMGNKDKYEVRTLRFEDKEYPSNLKEIHNPPPVLYIIGKLLSEDDNAIAVVGSRRCTEYGRRVTGDLAGKLAEAGVTIVSGLALGIDTIAHKEAVKRGTRTIAVLANGLDMIYPPENKILADRILKNGAIISEYPIGTEPLKQNFPARNRIISGLSRGILLTEATDKSGTLHTVNFGIEQNRDIYAVPGPVDSPLSVLPNEFIKKGAKAITCGEDILEDFTC